MPLAKRHGIIGGKLPLETKLHDGPCKLSGKDVCLDSSVLSSLKNSKDPAVREAFEKYQASPKQPADQMLLINDTVRFLGVQKAYEQMKNFKPAGEHKESYLSNYHEDAILKYVSELVDDGFHCIPVSLMDFPEPGYSYTANGGAHLRDFFKDHKDQLGNEIKTAGCVLNTLRSDGNLNEVGHWVCMFMDFRGKWTIEYYDSVGRQPPESVRKWMDSIAEKHKIPIEAHIASEKRSQKGDTECGMYALYYICCRVNGIHMKTFREKEIPDDIVTKFRKFVMVDAPQVEKISHDAYLTH